MSFLTPPPMESSPYPHLDLRSLLGNNPLYQCRYSVRHLPCEKQTGGHERPLLGPLAPPGQANDSSSSHAPMIFFDRICSIRMEPAHFEGEEGFFFSRRVATCFCPWEKREGLERTSFTAVRHLDRECLPMCSGPLRLEIFFLV